MAVVIPQSLFSRPLFPPTRMPYRVHTCGRVAQMPRHATMGTYNDDGMLFVFLAGAGHYQQKQRVCRVEPGMIGVVLPGAEVGVLFSDEKNPYDHLYCRFNGALALEVSRRISQAHDGASFFKSPLWLEVSSPLAILASSPPGTQGDDEVLADRMRPCDALLAQSLCILDCPEALGSGLTAWAVERFIAERLSLPMELDLMAEFFGVSKEYLCRRVKKLMGRSPLDLWREAKINWAKILLRKAGFGVAETARRVGFEDPYYFSRVFKQCTGTSPRQFLRGLDDTTRSRG